MKKIVLATALLGYVGLSSPYTYKVHNASDQNVDVEIRVGFNVLPSDRQRATIAPYETATFNFTGLQIGACLNDILVNGKSQLNDAYNRLINSVLPRIRVALGIVTTGKSELITLGIVRCGNRNFNIEGTNIEGTNIEGTELNFKATVKDGFPTLDN